MNQTTRPISPLAIAFLEGVIEEASPQQRIETLDWVWAEMRNITRRLVERIVREIVPNVVGMRIHREEPIFDCGTGESRANAFALSFDRAQGEAIMVPTHEILEAGAFYEAYSEMCEMSVDDIGKVKAMMRDGAAEDEDEALLRILATRHQLSLEQIECLIQAGSALARRTTLHAVIFDSREGNQPNFSTVE